MDYPGQDDDDRRLYDEQDDGILGIIPVVLLGIVMLNNSRIMRGSACKAGMNLLPAEPAEAVDRKGELACLDFRPRIHHLEAWHDSCSKRWLWH